MAEQKKRHYYTEGQMSEKAVRNLWKNFDGCKKVLDLGCGIGLVGKYKPKGVEVHGMDIDTIALGEAKKYEITLHGDIEKKLPYADNFFDGALVNDVLEHVLRPWDVVSELRRVLKDGGMVLASVPTEGAKAWGDYTHVRPFTEGSIKELFLDYGFKIEFLKRQRGIPGFGVLGLNVYIHHFLKIPIIGRLLTHGYLIKAINDKSS